MRDKSRLKHVMIQAKVSYDTAERIDNIVKKYGFSSRYEVMQYVLSAFLSKADPGYSNEEEQSRDTINEFGKLFEGFENKRNRIITTKMGKNLHSFLPIRYPRYAILHINLLNFM